MSASKGSSPHAFAHKQVKDLRAHPDIILINFYKILKGDFNMANRIMLNETSYHGSGAINEIATEAKAHGFKKAFVC